MEGGGRTIPFLAGGYNLLLIAARPPYGALRVVNEYGQQEHSYSTSVTFLDKDKSRLSSSSSAYEHVLLRQLFAYPVNWSSRFYQGDKPQTIAKECILPALSLDSDAIETADPTLSDRLYVFISTNLHQGLTLKDLSAHFGYSERYCSDFFHSTHGRTLLYVLRMLLTPRVLYFISWGCRWHACMRDSCKCSP